MQGDEVIRKKGFKKRWGRTPVRPGAGFNENV
jgi:hypothetical protein